MPSKHQSAAGGERFESDAKKMLATKNDLTIAALIRGIRKVDRAREYIDAEVSLAQERDRDVRKGIVGACNRKVRALEDGDTVDTPVDVDTGTGTDEDEDDDTAAHDADSDDGDTDDVQQADDTVDHDAPSFDDTDALSEAVDDHEHDGADVFTKTEDGDMIAGCFACESHIGVVVDFD
jgi:hypothetical protein